MEGVNGFFAKRMLCHEDNSIYITKFIRQDLIDVPAEDEVTLTITGRLTVGTPFEGSDTVKVIDKVIDNGEGEKIKKLR